MNNPLDILYGWHTVLTLLKQQPRCIQQIYVLQGRRDDRFQQLSELLNTIKTPSIRLAELTRDVFDQRWPDVTHQGIVAFCDMKAVPMYEEADLKDLLATTSAPIFLILDGVQDPHNLGACLRTANVAGVTAVLAPKDRNATLTATVHKVACGATYLTPFIAVTNLARTLTQLQEAGVWIYGLAGEATTSLYECDFKKGGVALVVGSEAKGLRQLTRQHCDVLAAIPMHGTVESLNVSVAAAIGLYEVVRQKHNP